MRFQRLWPTIALALVNPSAVARAVAPPIPLERTPAAVEHICVERARMRKFVVLCPTRYPVVHTSSVAPSGAVLLGPSFYWASFNDPAGFPDGDQGHLILGGQRHPFSLAGIGGQTWPRPGQRRPVQQLPLPRLLTTPMQNGKTFTDERPARVLERARVNANRGLVLEVPRYPQGGLSGGHIIILWNASGHGYFISLHFALSPTGTAYSTAARTATALAIAESAKPMAVVKGYS